MYVFDRTSHFYTSQNKKKTEFRLFTTINVQLFKKEILPQNWPRN